MENVVTGSLLQSIYQDKKVFITGHTGFKGAWLLAVLHLAGAKLKGYALAPQDELSLFSLLTPGTGVNSIIADIRDRERLKKEIATFQPDFIFHLAAQPLVRRSYEIPAETFDINVTGTANLLEAVKEMATPCTTIVVTTDKVYENKEAGILYREEDRLGGQDPYSASKACAEMVVSAFSHSYFSFDTYDKHKKTIATARAGNVIGGGDWNKDRIIPDIVRSLTHHEEVAVRNPAAIRPWQHVLECISGYLLLGARLYENKKRLSNAYNFGPLPQNHLAVKELVEMAIRRWGSGSWRTVYEKHPPHESGILKLDISLAEKELGWKPTLSAAQAIEWTIDWYKQPENNKAQFTIDQIKTFFAL